MADCEPVVVTYIQLDCIEIVVVIKIGNLNYFWNLHHE